MIETHAAPGHAGWERLGHVWVGLLVVASVVPVAGPSAPGADKLLHLVAFAFLMLWYRGAAPHRRSWLQALGLAVLGGAIELLQWRLPWRSAEVLDLAADAAGILVGLAVGRAGLDGWCSRLTRAAGGGAS